MNHSVDDTNYYLLKNDENFENRNMLIVSDASGNISTIKEIGISTGTFSNNATLVKILQAEKSLVGLIETRSKASGKNTLSARFIDKNAVVSDADKPLLSMDFTKLNNPGDWYYASSPDKKHIAIVGLKPYEKNQPHQFIYVLLDENLKEISKGNFSANSKHNHIGIFNFLVSDKGTMFIVSEEFDNTYKYPVIYQVIAGKNECTTTPVVIADPTLKNLSYTSAINADNDLVLAGYYQQKKTIGVGDIQAVGNWFFNSSKPQEVKTTGMKSPLENMKALNIVTNGNTLYLIGEQYKATLEKQTQQQILMRTFNYTYEHKNILVTAFDEKGAVKFEIPYGRSEIANNIDYQSAVASGILNNKLALFFNEPYEKYLANKEYEGYKLPVLVLISNDGLMDAPINFSKELVHARSGYTVYPQWYNSNKNSFSTLSGKDEQIKVITLK